MHACGAAPGQRPDEYLPEAVQGPKRVLAGSVGPHFGIGWQLHSGRAQLRALGADTAQVLAALAQPQGTTCRKESPIIGSRADTHIFPLPQSLMGCLSLICVPIYPCSHKKGHLSVGRQGQGTAGRQEERAVPTSGEEAVQMGHAGAGNGMR